MMYDENTFSIIISSTLVNNSQNLSGLLFLRNEGVQFRDIRSFKGYLYHIKFYSSLVKEKQVSASTKIARHVS